ncbi:MAG TPA: hypothetical protein VGK13_00380 [Methanocellaceae archaeon]|jgi:putative lipoic acid-binding regulatory protein
MFGKLEEIEGIEIKCKPRPHADDQGRGESKLEIRDQILELIRRIAGNDSIKRIVPIQNQGDHKSQDVVFEMDQKEFIATLHYNNALTEGWVEDVKKEANKC